MTNKQLLLQLQKEQDLPDSQLKQLLETFSSEDLKYASLLAREVKIEHYSNKIYLRGIVEFSNICKNNCYYCGLRRDNKNIARYQLNSEQIVSCCKNGYKLGLRTFVLQGGENYIYDQGKLTSIIKEIKKEMPDCAVTLGVGEKSRELYQQWFDSGADRYLLRHETINPVHYSKLHPSDQVLENRVRCLNDLKDIGYQTGAGMMVGSPYQTFDNLVEDLRFLKDFNPEMVGLGPFIPHSQTPFANEATGSYQLSLLLLAIVRMMLVKVLLPATTALETVNPEGRKLGLLSGCNVIMPNISPMKNRKSYKLYNGMAEIDDNAEEKIRQIKTMVESIGDRIVIDRGDYKRMKI